MTSSSAARSMGSRHAENRSGQPSSFPCRITARSGSSGGGIRRHPNAGGGGLVLTAGNFVEQALSAKASTFRVQIGQAHELFLIISHLLFEVLDLVVGSSPQVVEH